MRFNKRLLQTVSEAAMILTAASFNCQPELLAASEVDSGSGVWSGSSTGALQSDDDKVFLAPGANS
jgi:hypothetical protein